MFWFLLLVAIGSTVAVAYLVWRKWIAPWSRIGELVEGIAGEGTPRTFVIRGGGMPRRVAIAVEKIFDRQRQLAQQVSEGASGIETILGAMQDGLLVVDAARHVTLANDTFAELFDVREISLGAPLLDTVRDTTLDQMIAETLNTGESTRREITASGRELEVSAVPLQDEVDETNGVVVLVHDITQRKRLDEVRKDFVANVSHELRTPLSILRGYIETLRENPETSAKELSRILEVMERHSKRLGLLVEDLLSLAQLESPDPNLQLSDVNLEELFANIVRDWEKALAGKRLKMIVDLAVGLPMIRADDTRLQEILYNLLDNAVKYSSKGGEILLRARKRDGEIVISVGDTGVGIRPEDLPRIFERFYRVDKARSREVGGTGLGLSIVKHIAQLHGGSVEAESVVGQGTTIHVVIPIVAVSAAAIVTQT